MNENLEENFFYKNCYFISLKSKIATLNNSLLNSKLIIDSNETNLILTSYIENTKYLGLKIELTNFSIEILGKYNFKMNYIVFFEKRKKIGNIISQKLLNKFYKNLVEIKQKEENIDNLFQFKTINNDKEEVDKAIICNLFFILKKKLDDEFTKNIHNFIISISSILKKEIVIFEVNIKNKVEKKNLNEIEKKKTIKWNVKKNYPRK